MSKYSKDGVSVLSVLDARRVKKSGLFPVKIQVVLKSLFCWNTRKSAAHNDRELHFRYICRQRD